MKLAFPMKKFLIFAFLVLLSFCAPGKKIDITPQITELQNRINEADALFKRGSYSCLKEAFNIYQDLLSSQFDKKHTKEKLVKTALFLAIREKELAILDETYLKKAASLIEESPALSKFSQYLEIVNSISVKSKGTVRDIIEDSFERRKYLKKMQDSKKWIAQLRERAENEEFLAYLYLSLNCPNYYVRTDVKADFSRFLELFPESVSVKFIFASCTGENQDLLKEIIQREPRFFEIYYFLGEIALKQRLLITAEKNFLKAYQEIPESSALVISLASVYFTFEEIDKSLEFYEKALILAPEYRDALLGKAICLSYLGRNTEAMKVCKRLISLGKWYLGESYYWLAWNKHELEDNEAASEYVERSKNLLPTSSEVFTLSGIINFEKEKLEEAEKNFKQALELERLNCEASFYLGKIYAQKRDWKNSGLYFEKAAHCNKFLERGIEGKIEEIKTSSLSDERKAKLIRRKRNQLIKVTLTKATAFYNAAAGYFNSGSKEKSLNCAREASLHRFFKQKAEELISRIRDIKQ